MSKFKLPKNSDTFFASFKQILNCHFQFGHSSAQSPRELVVSVSLSVNLTSLRGYVSQTSPYLYVRGCYGCPAQGEKAELKFDREIPSSCLTCTLTRCNACIHSVKDTYCLLRQCLRVTRPLPWQAAVTLLWLFMSRLRTLRPASTAHSSVTVPQSKMNKNPLSSLKQNRGRSIKNAKKLTNKNLWHRYFYDYENILPNSVTKFSKHNFWPVIFSLWMQMSVSHAVNAVIVVDKNNIYVLINT